MAQYLVVVQVGNSDSDAGDHNAESVIMDLNLKDLTIMCRWKSQGMWEYATMPVTFKRISEVIDA